MGWVSMEGEEFPLEAAKRGLLKKNPETAHGGGNTMKLAVLAFEKFGLLSVKQTSKKGGGQ